jgi:Rrf2 family protein
MKLSSKGRYGVRALFDLAFYAAEGSAQIKDIAARQAIPARFLEQIFQDLRRAGLITSKRGPRGGYRLARPAGEIRLGDIVRVLDGPIRTLLNNDPVHAAGRRASGAQRDAVRATESVLRDVSVEIEACFDRVSLEDVVRKAEALGARRPGGGGGQPIVYAI